MFILSYFRLLVLLKFVLKNLKPISYYEKWKFYKLRLREYTFNLCPQILNLKTIHFSDPEK